MADDFLAYRFSSFADSAFGEVILKYSNGHYQVAAEYMMKSSSEVAISDEKIDSWRMDFRNHGYYGDAPPSLVQAMTDLVFSGNKDIAFDLVDRAWPRDLPGKPEFLGSYEEALAESRFYAEFKTRMGADR